MRIGFDGHALTSPAGGVRRYTWELFGAMARITSEDAIVALGAAPGAPPPGVRASTARSWLPGNAGWVIGPLALAVRRSRLDLFHAPAYTAPVMGVHPLVLTIHDVSYERHPEWYPYRRDPFRRWFYRRSALAADRIITDSEFSRTEIAAAYGIPVDRIHVVPLGRSTLGGEGPSPEAGGVPGVGQPYVLHVGDLHPRRNLIVLIRALHQAARRPGCENIQLVLAGVDRGEGDRLRQEAERLGVSTAIRFLDRVSDTTLASLYAGASVFAYPSRYEGFGLPLLEAMASGSPVIASNAASIPEVVGDAGVLLDPDDETGFAHAIERVTQDRAFAHTLREAGRERALAFSWERAARQTLAVYRELFGWSDRS